MRRASLVRSRVEMALRALLIVENEFTDSGREVHPLPLPLLGPSLRSVVGWDACAGRPDGVRRSAQVMGGDVSHRNRLARRQCSELAGSGIPRAAAFAWKAARCASPIRTSPRIQARPTSIASPGRLSPG